MSLANAQNTTIIGSSFTDIGGDLIYNVVRQDSGIHGLLQAISTSASYDAVERQPPPKCHPGTRVKLLDDIRSWINDTEGKEILWLHGPAGAGKSAIAQTVCESCAEQGELLASFFFSRGSSDRHNINKFIATLAFQIALSRPDKRQALHRVVEDDPLIIHRTIEVQLKRLIVELFQRDIGHSRTWSTPFLIVIDGLDECSGTSDQTSIISLIHDLIQRYCLPIRFLILSRPEPQIEHAFKIIGIVILEMSLLGNRQARDDVRVFLQNEFEKIHDSEVHSDIMKHIPKPWPSKDDLQLLVERSDGYFIYASTVIKYVGEEHFSCVGRLCDVFNGLTPFAALDQLYAQILSTCSNLPLLKSILACSFSREIQPVNLPVLGVSDYTVLFGLEPGEVMMVLRGMHSIISLDGENEEEWTIEPLHATFPEFLFDASRSGIYFVDKKECYKDVIQRSLVILRDGNYRNDTFDDTWVTYSYIWVHQLPFRGPDLIDLIRETMSFSDWEYHVRISACWPLNSRTSLAHMLNSAVGEFEALEHPPEDLIQTFTELLYLAFEMSLNLTSDRKGKAAMVQDIHSIYSVLPDNIIYNSADNNKITRYTIVFTRNYVARGTDDWFDLHGFIRTVMTAAHFDYAGHGFLLRSMRDSFSWFMEDAIQDRAVYFPKHISHSRIACCCLAVPADVSNGGDKELEYVAEYARNHLLSHLILSETGDKISCEPSCSEKVKQAF